LDTSDAINVLEGSGGIAVLIDVMEASGAVERRTLEVSDLFEELFTGAIDVLEAFRGMEVLLTFFITIGVLDTSVALPELEASVAIDVFKAS
jgi:hypothetical protein